MAPSQLKQLKTSLHGSGIIAPQNKKPQNHKGKSGSAANAKLHRNAAIKSIREKSNPFEVRAPSRPAKFAVTSRDRNASSIQHRPGVSRGLTEERRNQTILRGIEGRHKVGGILDRRFGENDPTMTPEQRTAERFARENQMRSRKEAMFSLEEGEEEEMQLTHMGESLVIDSEIHDFPESNPHGTDANLEPLRKRKRLGGVVDDAGESIELENEEETQRKKSKNEVMREIITKSKFYKYERQKAKEDDNDLRESLDKGLPQVFEMMRGSDVPQSRPPIGNAIDLGAKPNVVGVSHEKLDATEQQYDRRLRQLVYDKRSKASDRTKTEEEIAVEEAGRLKELEQERLRRMHEATDDTGGGYDTDRSSGTEYENDDAKRFGLHQGRGNSTLAVEDEDNFVIDDDLVESRSFIGGSPLSGSDAGYTSSEEEEDDDDDDDYDDIEFLKGLKPTSAEPMESVNTTSGKDTLAFTYPCPETHEDFLRIVDGLSVDEIPTVVQRIRALYHPRLDGENKAKLSSFAGILVQHIEYMSNEKQPPLYVLENLLRHIHSLSKSYPQEVSASFRSRLRDIADKRPLKLLPGDLILLTGVATIFPTSDNFHIVVTPSVLSMCRYLGHCSFTSLEDLVTGAYVASLCLQYQGLSKRYVPEFINFITKSLSLLLPEPKGGNSCLALNSLAESNPIQTEVDSVRQFKTPRFWEVFSGRPWPGNHNTEKVKVSILGMVVSLLDVSMDLWSDEEAFGEIFSPAHDMLLHFTKSGAGINSHRGLDSIRHVIEKFDSMLLQAERNRGPLLLQNHKPLPIKMAIPKFEDAFNPERHYDPNHERAQLSKLKAEHKKERKGAMRELRKDANFIARANLQEKKVRDAEYEKKYSRLVAEIQGEEGHNAKIYDEEKRRRKMKR